MELTCALAPPVYVELYAMLAECDRAAELEPRLNLIDRDASWLAEMAQSYRRLWQYRLTLDNAEEIYEGLPSHHADLATWLLSVLRGDAAEFSRVLRRRAREELRKAPEDGSLPDGPEGQPAVVAWTLGAVYGKYDRELPVVFAEDPPDLNVRLAYEGLVHHLIDLGERDEPWPEVVTTSVLWRCAGIAEGLAPQANPNLASSLNQLMALVRTYIPAPMWRELSGTWEDFRKTRNALTHLTGRDGDPCFTDVGAINNGREHLRMALVGSTHFVANSIRTVLADPDSDLGRAGLASAIEDELSWFEGFVA
ncbi:hypothetical protein [Micromonospora sp. NPDC005087]|uniref:hypothetical protein n=1 Tax=Micromonospora sp. NPDC005087 TaxID=3364225 RepID=UPI0036C2A2E8